MIFNGLLRCSSRNDSYRLFLKFSFLINYYVKLSDFKKFFQIISVNLSFTFETCP